MFPCLTPLPQFFEGLALGSLTSYDNLWGTLLAIFSHKVPYFWLVCGNLDRHTEY